MNVPKKKKVCVNNYLEKSFEYILALITSRSVPNEMFKFGIARKIATSDWIVLLYTTGLYCLKSSDVKPLSWIILKK